MRVNTHDGEVAAESRIRAGIGAFGTLSAQIPAGPLFVARDHDEVAD
jgi:hypothetical protein